MGAGCRGTGTAPTADQVASSTPDAIPTSVECRHEYYPLVAGYRALYRTTLNGVDKGTYSITVPWVRNNEAYVAAVFTGAGGSPVVNSNQQFRCHNGELEAKGYVDTGGLQPGGTDMNKAEVHSDAVTGSFFPKNITPGSEWESSVKMTIKPKKAVDGFELPAATEPLTITVRTKKHAVGLEQIDLPFGRKEAMKIEVTTYFDDAQTFTKLEWWVKDIGMVQSLAWASVLESDPPVVTRMNDFVLPRE